MNDMSKILEDLKQKRDELRLQIELGSMEAKQEWEELEEKWKDFSSKAGLGETVKNVGSSLELLGKELMAGYERIKKAL